MNQGPDTWGVPFFIGGAVMSTFTYAFVRAGDGAWGIFPAALNLVAALAVQLAVNHARAAEARQEERKVLEGRLAALERKATADALDAPKGLDKP